VLIETVSRIISDRLHPSFDRDPAELRAAPIVRPRSPFC
jgi:hypothetical protein